MTTATKYETLSKEIWAVGIHGITGQQIDEGTLAVGTLVRNIREYEDTPDGPIYRFEASTDGGKLWYTQQSYAKPTV